MPLFRSPPFRILGPFLSFFSAPAVHPSIHSMQMRSGLLLAAARAVRWAWEKRVGWAMFGAKSVSFPDSLILTAAKSLHSVNAELPFPPLFLSLFFLPDNGRAGAGRAGMPREFALFCALKRASHENTTQFSPPSLSSLSAHPSRLSVPPFPHLIPSFAQWPRARFDHGRTHARTTGQWAERKRERERERERQRGSEKAD